MESGGVFPSTKTITLTIPDLNPITQELLPAAIGDQWISADGPTTVLLDENFNAGLGCDGQSISLTMDYGVNVPFAADTLSAATADGGEILTNVSVDSASAWVNFDLRIYVNHCSFLKWLDKADGVRDYAYNYELTATLEDLQGSFDFIVDEEDDTIAITDVTDFSLDMTDVSVTNSLGSDSDHLEGSLGNLLDFIQNLSETSGWTLSILGQEVLHIDNPASGIWTFGECHGLDDCVKTVINDYVETEENEATVRETLEDAIHDSLSLSGSSVSDMGSLEYVFDDVTTSDDGLVARWDWDFSPSETEEPCGNLTARHWIPTSNGEVPASDIEVSLPYAIAGEPLAVILSGFCFDVDGSSDASSLSSSSVPAGTLDIAPGFAGLPSSVTDFSVVNAGQAPTGLANAPIDATAPAPNRGASLRGQIQVAPISPTANGSNRFEQITEVSPVTDVPMNDDTPEHPLDLTVPMTTTITESVTFSDNDTRAKTHDIFADLVLTTEIKTDCAGGVYLNEVSAKTDEFASHFPEALQADVVDAVERQVDQLNQDKFPLYLISKVTELADWGYSIEATETGLGETGATLGFEIVEGNPCEESGNNENQTDGGTGIDYSPAYPGFHEGDLIETEEGEFDGTVIDREDSEPDASF